MASGALFLLLAVLLLLGAAGTWVVRQRGGGSPRLELVPVVLPSGQNHGSVRRHVYQLSDYLDGEQQLRDQRQAEHHALKVGRLREYELRTQHQAELAAEQARDEAAWEQSKGAIAQWAARQQQDRAAQSPPPPAPVDFQDVSLSPARRRQAIFQQLTVAASAVAA